jgi:hypothetical protein
LEAPHDALFVDVRASVDEQVATIRSALGLTAATAP